LNIFEQAFLENLKSPSFKFQICQKLNNQTKYILNFKTKLIKIMKLTIFISFLIFHDKSAMNDGAP
jgi:hypothetical protein